MDRIEALLRQLPALDGVLITSQVNRFYFTGMASSAGTVLATRNGSALIIDSRYFEAAQAKVRNCEVILQDQLPQQLQERINAHGVQTLGVEEDTVSLREWARFREMLPQAKLVADGGVSAAVNKLRRIKTAEEIARITAAQRIAEDTLEYAKTIIKPGLKERDLALEMEVYSRRNGSEEASFSFIAAAGKNSAMPHAAPGDYAIRNGDFIVLDFGCTVGGYRSDMTRTVAVGQPSAKQRDVYQTVLDAQTAALEMIRPGVPCNEVDKVARDLIDAGPYRGLFGHGLGHALGLEVHEDPAFSPRCPVILEPGMVLSVEPGIYLPGEFGVRIEDVVAITENGYENLVGSPKNLQVL